MKARRFAVRWISAALSLGGVNALLRARRRRKGDFRVFILEYHGVDPDGREWEGTISQRRFRRHLQWLQRRFNFCTVAEAAERLAAGKLDRDWCVLTFDDGYLNNVEGAFPVLQELGIPATIYLTTGFLDGEELWFDIARRALGAERGPNEDHHTTPPWVAEELGKYLGSWPPADGLEATMKRLKYLPAKDRLSAVDHLKAAGLPLGEPARPMSWDQARALRDAGIELGAHTVKHPILSKLGPAEQRDEILGSARRLTEELGEAPRTFAMPNGSARDYDEHTLAILRDGGFRAACTTRRGSCRPGCDPYQLFRLGVGSDSTAVLDTRLSGFFDAGVRRLIPFLGSFTL